MNMDKRLQISLVGIFSVVAFMATGFVVYQSAHNLQADGEVEAPLVSPAAEVSPAPDTTPVAEVSPSALPSDAAAGVVIDPTSPDPVASLPVVTTQSSGFDYRYLVLIIDAIVIAVLVAVLAIRLLMKILSQSADTPAAPATTAAPVAATVLGGNNPVTVDQLDIDIPL